MPDRISIAAVLLFAAFAPIEGQAALVFSDVSYSATTLARTELSPPVVPRTAPLGDATRESLLVTSGAAMAASQEPDGAFEHF